MKKITDEIERVLFSREEIAQCVRKLGKAITEDYRDRELLVIGVLKGAGIFMSDLIREIYE